MISFHSSPLYLGTTLTVSDQSGLLPPAGPISDRHWKGSNFIHIAIPPIPVELHTQGELTSPSFKDSAPHYYVETKFLQEAILSTQA